MNWISKKVKFLNIYIYIGSTKELHTFINYKTNFLPLFTALRNIYIHRFNKGTSHIEIDEDFHED